VRILSINASHSTTGIIFEIWATGKNHCISEICEFGITCLSIIGVAGYVTARKEMDNGSISKNGIVRVITH
jgi:hypothetical protein